jgi:kynurenine formamidase
MGEAAVVDLSHLGENSEVNADELERHAGNVRPGDIVLLRTDWPRKASVDDPRFRSEAPYTARSACEWLVERKVKAVGYDYPPDHSIRTMIAQPECVLQATDCPTHDVFFRVGVTVIEYLTILDQIGAPRCRFLALPLKIDGADGAPVRAIAMV